MSNCDFNWMAPFLHQDGKVSHHSQQCAQPIMGHEGDHRSSGKVTHPRRVLMDELTDRDYFTGCHGCSALLGKLMGRDERIEELELGVHLRNGRIEALERDLLGLTDTHDPVARGEHCTFCHHPMGLSVFGPDMLDSQLHYDDCLWIARRALEADQ